MDFNLQTYQRQVIDEVNMARLAFKLPTELRAVHWLGRCPVKGCKVRLHVDSPLKAVQGHDRGIMGIAGSARPVVRWEQVWHPHSALYLHCATHRREIAWKAVNGSFSQEHVCDARCMNATGPSCECSCGGQNHGRANHISTPWFNFKA